MLAALVAPLAGIGGTADALPMALLITVLPCAALGSLLALAGTNSGQPPVPVPSVTGPGAALVTAEPG